MVHALPKGKRLTHIRFQLFSVTKIGSSASTSISAPAALQQGAGASTSCFRPIIT